MFVKSLPFTKLALVLALGMIGFSDDVMAENRKRTLLKNNMTERDIILTLTNEAPQGTEASLFFPIQFALNSDQLNEKAVKTLAKIAVALQSLELQGLEVVVEGHTDASGSAEYNQGLSERRARSAATFLNSLGVPKNRLLVVGRGEADPIEDTNPYAAMQRRVEIVRVY